MHFSISNEIFQKFPALNVGIIVVRDVNNSASPSELKSLLKEAEAEVRKNIPADNFKTHPAIQVWQEAHRAFGSNPNKFQPSLQALIKRVIGGGELPTIGPLVDCYNVISLRRLLPAGGEDTDKCSGNVLLTLAVGGEHFIELGKTELEPPTPGEVIYRDDVGVLCRKFNWREADRTKLTSESRNAILVLECLLGKVLLERALEDLSGLVQKFAGGTSEVSVVSAETQREVKVR